MNLKIMITSYLYELYMYMHFWVLLNLTEKINLIPVRVPVINVINMPNILAKTMRS